MRKKITVDAEKCVHCGMCIKDCVLGIIAFDGNDIPHYTPGGEKQCVGCQHCMAICPSGALSFGDKNAQDSSPVGLGNSADLLQLIKSRRSYRFYKNEDVPADKLQQLIAMLPFIPTGGNADNLHFSIVATKEKMEAIRATTYSAILKLQQLSKFQMAAKNAYTEGKDIIYRGAPSLVAVAIDKEKTIEGCETADPIIALSYFELYAQSLGLGTVWCDMALTIANQLPEVYALLEIPSNYTLNYVMLFGVPAIKYTRTIQPEMFAVKLLR
ncbi:MAG: nitroreductase family protein [Desulfovibrio sp.]|nr:nitroreductase family protein [Desulfovibrio sp.]